MNNQRPMSGPPMMSPMMMQQMNMQHPQGFNPQMAAMHQLQQSGSMPNVQMDPRLSGMHQLQGSMGNAMPQHQQGPQQGSLSNMSNMSASIHSNHQMGNMGNMGNMPGPSPMNNPLLMQQMAMQMQNMAKMQQMQHMQQQMAMQGNNMNKKMAQIDPKAAHSAKAVKLQKLQMEKMKAAMETQMNDLQRTGRSALSGDWHQIESVLILFGVQNDMVSDIIENFKKLNIKDSDLKNIDLSDDKLLKKLIPNTKDTKDEIRNRFIQWIRYDIKKLHIHELSDCDEKKLTEVDEVITLNISGRKYTTLKSTLLKTGSSYFHLIFDSKSIEENKCIKDKDGNYFINRNGRLFEPILVYLQTQELTVKMNEWYDINDVFEEMQFYDIQLPAQYNYKNDPRGLPDSFRFEYSSMYNQLRHFFASQFRILPKANANSIINGIGGSFPKDCRDIEAFLDLKQKLKDLGYGLKDTQVFRGDPSQWVWTYVEFYQRIKWKQK